MKHLFFPVIFLFLGISACQSGSDPDQSTAEDEYVQTPSDLSGYWDEVSRTVREGDFDGYADTYHKDAVFVGAMSGESYPIASALAGWKEGFDLTAAGKQQSDVVFRFSQQLSDATTAHATGIFHYTAVDSTGVEAGYYINFEALLVMKNGWKMIMEYQKSEATEEDWKLLEKAD